MASFKEFLAKAKRKWDRLNSEEEKLRKIAKQATEEENRLEREEKLAWVQKEKYRLKKQVEQAKLEYLRAKAARQKAEKGIGSGGTWLSRAGASLEKMFGPGKSSTSGKKRAGKQKDPWNFWD